MKQIIIILFLIWAGWGKPQMAGAQASIEGKVMDARTGQPLEDTNVYLSGTKIGAAANPAGLYRLDDIPAGGYRLVVSRIGYATQIITQVIGSGEHRKIDFKLKPVRYQLPETFVGDFDKGWKKNLKRFTDNFIGQSARADSVKIINPEVLRFDKNWWGRLKAEALAPLKIENRALGYYITYHLKAFNHSGGRTRWDGEPLFTEMTPVDPAQAAYWEENRRKAFYGSLRHFLLALIADRVKEEGFVLYNQRQGVRGYSSRNRSRISGKRLIREDKKDFLHKLNFFGRLEIIYTREEEEPQYTRWLHSPRRAPRGRQISYLKLNEHPITVDADGEIIQPYGATQFGYFAYSLLANLTPRGYRPEGSSLR